jgi:glycosyltransferase involved in cell wall biosynthesis
MRPCVLIPAFNEELHIDEVIGGVRRHVGKVIVVDDGSGDRTAEIAASSGAEVIRHEKNLGKGASLKTGMKKAFDEGFDPVIIIDADAQHDPLELPLFLEAARRGGADVVVGNRMGATKGMPRIRYLTNLITSFFVSLLAGQRVPDSQCGYRLIRKNAFEKMRLKTARYDTEAEMLIEAARAGCRIDSIPIKTIYGIEKSAINPFRDAFRFVRLVIRNMRR